MKKIQILAVFLVVVFLCACGKTNSIDLSSLKSDEKFCYKNIDFNINLEDTEEKLGIKCEFVGESEGLGTELYIPEKDFDLYGCSGYMTLEFKNEELKVLRFVFNDPEDDLEDLFDKLIEDLKELYLVETEKITGEGDTRIGSMESLGYRWDLDNGEVKTTLTATMMNGEKIKTTVQLAVGIIESE